MNNEYMADYMLRRYHQRRNKAIQKLGGQCVRCSSVEDLQFDHINPDTKVFAIAKMWSVTESLFWEEVTKCQILCKSCHIEKTHVDAGRVSARGRHGTVSTYRYCEPPKCEDCKQAVREVNQRWRARKRAKPL